MFARSHSFEPRVGKVQKIFGICYLILALTGVALALYAQSMGAEPYLQYFMTVLFIVMAGKSFYIAHRVSNLIKNGLLGLSLNNLIQVLTPYKTGEFETITGKLTLGEGQVQNLEIKSKGNEETTLYC